MLKEFYNAILSRIDSLVIEPEDPKADPVKVIKQKGWWNEQWAYEKQNPALAFPCVFVEITTIPWEQLGKQVQQANALVRLHIGSRSLNDENVDHLDLIESLNYVMTGFQGTNFGSWTRISTDLDHNHDSLVAHVISYRVRIRDNTAIRPLISKLGDLFYLEINIPKYRVGQQAMGGVIFEVDATGRHGKVASHLLSAAEIWSTSGEEIGADSDDGAVNSQLIIESMEGDPDCAARLCINWDYFGYSDWYLPSLAEMRTIYTYLFEQLFKYGGDDFWTSNEDTAENAIVFSFRTGEHFFEPKSENKRVMAVRKF